MVYANVRNAISSSVLGIADDSKYICDGAVESGSREMDSVIATSRQRRIMDPSRFVKDKSLVGSIVTYLAFTAAIFRAEVAALAAPILASELFLTRRANISAVLRTGVLASASAVLLTLLLDSYFWGRPFMWPEAASFVFNAIEGKHADWGIHPWWYYVVLVPRIATIAVPLAAYAAYAVPPSRIYLLPSLVFVAIYSGVGHKEWRFVQYVVPVLNLSAGMALAKIHEGAEWCTSSDFAGTSRDSVSSSRIYVTSSNRRNVYRWVHVAALLGLLISALSTAFSVYVSSLNYPGGVALSNLHKLVKGPPKGPAQVYVHMDVLTCMTGATRFGELWSDVSLERKHARTAGQPANETAAAFADEHSGSYWRYSKDETHNRVADFELAGYTHVLTEDPRLFLWVGKWKIINEVEGYAGLDVRFLKMQWWRTLSAAALGEWEGGVRWDRLWETVTKDSSDFSSWEGLIRLAEAVDGGLNPQSPPEALQRAQTVYDHFLAKFPLCFGYWKKYADLEMAVEGAQVAEGIFERGIQSIHNSTELWTHYITFKIEHTKDDDKIRELFERGAAAIGLDFMSHPFWDKYLEFEESRHEHGRMLSVLERVIRIPLHQYARFFEKYSQLSVTRPVAEILTTEEYNRLEAEIRAVPVALKEGEQPRDRTAAEFDLELRQRIHALKSEIYMNTQAEVMKRWVYEGEIRRPYFHVKPLDDVQLNNWRKYLDFEEGEGDVARAMYEEFWLRYVKYLMNLGDSARAANALYRAVNIHVHPTRIQIRLLNAALQEAQGEISEARQSYRTLVAAVPTAAEPAARLAHFERRQGHIEDALATLDTALSKMATKANGNAQEDDDGEAAGVGARDVKGRMFLLIQKAFLLLHAFGLILRWNKQVCEKAVLKGITMGRLSYIWPLQAPEHVKSAFEALRSSSHLSSEDRRDFALRYLDYVTERGNDPPGYVSLFSTLNKEFPAGTGAESSRKRGLDDDLTNSSKKARTGSSPSGSPYQAPQQAPVTVIPLFAVSNPSSILMAMVDGTPEDIQLEAAIESHTAMVVHLDQANVRGAGQVDVDPVKTEKFENFLW
ncbi:PRP39 pre-mRNA processing factor 39 [Gonapodya sp. JEL0774]|nr:PRP39 pre-mRNA processing factor 39 [Gonapodya sp. JEL0774]